MLSILLGVVTGLNSYWDEAYPWNYQVRYTLVDGKRCDEKMESTFLTNPAKTQDGASLGPVYLHQCAYKCSNGCASKVDSAFVKTRDGSNVRVGCFCDGSLPSDPETAEIDPEDSVFSLCGDQALLMDLCDASPECYGIQMHTSRTRGFLLYTGCQKLLLDGSLPASDGSYTYLAKMDPENQGGDISCPLGVAVTAGGLGHYSTCEHGDSLDDLYVPDTARGNGFYAGCSQLEWSETGCGWVVKVTPEVDDDGPVGPVGPQECETTFCQNQPYAANWLFGFEDGRYRESICEDTEPWLANGYCSNELWQALCPVTCNTPCDVCDAWAGNNEAAAAVIVEMLDIEVHSYETVCAVLNDPYEMCDDPVVAVVCAATCGSARRLDLSDGKAAPHLRPHYLPQLKHLLQAAADLRSRRLQASEERVVLYGTWDPTGVPDWCARGQGNDVSARQKPPDYSILNAGVKLYNHLSFTDAHALSMRAHCPLQETYTTTPNMYCTGNNIVINEPTIIPEEIINELCFNKCLESGTQPGNPSGAPGYCDGSDPAFNAYSNALCVPRAKCEAYCSMLDNCVGIEYHREKPRCYLATTDCTLGEAIQAKVTSPEYDFAKKAEGVTAYKTHFKQTCSGGLSPESMLWPDIAAAGNEHICRNKCKDGYTGADCDGYIASEQHMVCAARSVCEQICSSSDTCQGFEMHVTKQRCMFTRFRSQYSFSGNALCTDCLADPLDPEGRCTLKYQGGSSTMTPMGTISTLNGYQTGSVWSYVEKKLSGGSGVEVYRTPCIAQVEGLGEASGDWLAQRAGSGDCAGLNYEGNCYVKQGPDGATWRAAYAGQEARYDLSEANGMNRKCDGWILQEFKGGNFHSVLSTFPAGECPAGTTAEMKQYHQMFAWEPEILEDAELNYQCLSYPSCGTLMTCVLARGRFESELHRLLDLGVEDTHFQPKTLISVEKAVAFVAKDKWQWADELHRNVPGPLRLRLRTPGLFDKALLTMVSADAVASQRGLGLAAPYARVAGHDDWYTDIVRVERFDRSGAKLQADGSFRFDLYAPGVPQLVVYHFGDDYRNPTEVPCFQVADDPGWWTVTAALDGDYVGTAETPCPAMPPSNIANADARTNAVCPSREAGAECPLVCKDGFSKTGDFVCRLGQWSTDVQCQRNSIYEAEVPLYRLTHWSRLDYGWRIRQVFLYSDAECTRRLTTQVTVHDTSGDYDGFPRGNLFDSSETNFQALSDEDLCVSNPGSCRDWWSAGLNVNPYTVDETHGTAAYVDFSVPSGVDVQCLRVVSRATGPQGTDRQYYPTEMALYRGWKTNARQATEMVASPVRVNGWTETFTRKVSEADKTSKGLEATFATGCGTRQVIYAELLENVSPVPSACHCKQLCIDKIAEGCRTWKYSTKTKVCYLQEQLMSVESGSESACTDQSEWISGDTGLRLLSAEPATVPPGEDFTLTVHGVNLPTDDTAELHAATPARQRVKIVDAGSVCAETEVSETVRGIRCSHPYFCAPKPSAYSDAAASWTNISIHSSSESKTYKVCYNKGQTFDRYEWHEVPTQVDVRETVLAWQTEPKEVKRTTPSFALTIDTTSLHAFHPTDVDEWRVKLIKSYFDCATVLTDVDVTLGTGIHDHAGSTTSATWTVGIYDVAIEKFASVGLYKVCLAEDGEHFHSIPSSGGDMYLEIKPDGAFSQHPRDVFTYQTASGRLGEEFNLKLAGHQLYLPASSKIRLLDQGGQCGQSHGIDAAVDEDASDADAYAFPLLVDDVEPGDYTVCYCDAQKDGLQPAVNASVYTVEAHRRCTSAPLLPTSAASDPDAVPLHRMGGDFAEDACVAKCARGCVGERCFCDAFDPDAMLGAEDEVAPLCLSSRLCRDACEATDICTGFDFDPESNFCWLRQGCSGSYDETKEAWTRNSGEACTHEEDFAVEVGVLTLTRRVEMNTQWVLTPGEHASIEVLGNNLSYARDRIMFVDCTGTCGVSSPAEAVTLPGASQKVFNSWVARNTFLDPPHDNEEGPYVAPPAASADALLWHVRAERYCPGNNMDVTTISAGDASRHQCYKKCVADAPCVGDDCFCGGLFAGYDGEDSAALCLDEATCKAVCQANEDCFGIDMHAELDRCFLNGVAPGPLDEGSCASYLNTDQLAPYEKYNFWYKQPTGARMLQERRLLPAVDSGNSWDEMLRFDGVTFSAGGKFKVCFCDYETLVGDNVVCAKTEHYKLEIGVVHVSGVSCLLEESKFQRGTCISQRHGGLRCYPGPHTDPTYPFVAADLPIPTDGAADDGAVGAETSTWCLYGPEEETRDDPRCQWPQ
jgi:hypothetical protein